MIYSEDCIYLEACSIWEMCLKISFLKVVKYLNFREGFKYISYVCEEKKARTNSMHTRIKKKSKLKKLKSIILHQKSQSWDGCDSVSKHIWQHPGNLSHYRSMEESKGKKKCFKSNREGMATIALAVIYANRNTILDDGQHHLQPLWLLNYQIQINPLKVLL